MSSEPNILSKFSNETLLKIAGFLVILVGAYVEYRFLQSDMTDLSDEVVLIDESKANLDDFTDLTKVVSSLKIKIEEIEKNKASTQSLTTVEQRLQKKIGVIETLEESVHEQDKRLYLLENQNCK